MNTVTETIEYAQFVRPFRRGLYWLAVYFAITLPVAALFLRSDVEDFIFVCVLIVFPGSILPFVSPWSRARQLAKQTKNVSVAPGAITVDDCSHELTKCRWFRGFAFHDPKLGEYPAPMSVIVVTWFPFSNEDRTICGLTPDTNEAVGALLERESVPQDKPRRINERFLLNIATIGAAVMVISLMACINFFADPGIPFPSIAISSMVGGMAARIWIKHQFGQLQFQKSSSATYTGWAALIIAGTLKINRRNRGGPLLQNAAFFTWVLPLALVQVFCLFSLYTVVRSREDALLESQSQHTKSHT